MCSIASCFLIPQGETLDLFKHKFVRKTQDN